MIPKIIHYCWFGGNPKPYSVSKCINSWKKYLPDYEIIEWNESNFDINSMPYVKEAYENRKYAFVSDVARLEALSKKGGIYLDTDVEILRSFDEFLDNETFMGFETKDRLSTAIIGCTQGVSWVNDLLDNYRERHFVQNGVMDTTTNVKVITDYMKSMGLGKGDRIITINNIGTFYPSEYFSPKSYYDGIIYKTNNTFAIHHFTGTWQEKSRIRMWLSNNISPNFISFVRKIKKAIVRCVNM